MDYYDDNVVAVATPGILVTSSQASLRSERLYSVGAPVTADRWRTLIASDHGLIAKFEKALTQFPFTK